MILRRANEWLGHVKTEIQHSFTEEHTVGETAGSFSVGVFITMLPTLGTGLLAFVVLAWVSERINRAALLASVVVFNPAVKWGVYAASFTLGVAILGPVPGVTAAEVSLSAGPDIVARILVGNVILAVVAAVPSYVVCYRLVEAYRAREFAVVETVTEVVTPDDGEESDTSTGSEEADREKADATAADPTGADASDLEESVDFTTRR
ncbi:hypothetical protein SAMN04488066_11231 [Halorubrum aquaticum]|uniref:DUF2062 domain-containing protein n=1 Tax=Halorubrum aquaticum TaxID=387340 RepID=A0A1I3BFB0_9EURY|nr:DUF2062 domain-containing protein [Halorubrum aquaticum]SFH60995.1 hypothetical protein SAMN04488066_11231 [Halorubrum aquaticum]